MRCVLAIVSICALSMVACQRGDSIRAGRERTLRQDLSTLRSAIDQYKLDKQQLPQSLNDLVSSGYIKVLPEEPTTRRTDCWVPVQEDPASAVDNKHLGIVDVHSCNNQLSSDGTAYSNW
jgi:general secretion pathway protein G